MNITMTGIDDGRTIDQIIGLAPGSVQLRPYDPAWSYLYELERQELMERIGPHALAIEHIGSTAIPGIPSKPILDIAIAVTSFEEADVCVEPLADISYEYKGESGVPKRRFFSKGNPRTHHLHILEIESAEWANHLLFRDYLRAHPGTASAYALLKLDLAGRFANDREAYTDGKIEFIHGILRLAEVWKHAG